MYKTIRLSAIVLICSYFTLSIATEPSLPPYHQYYVTGRIERLSNGNKSLFVVSLVGKFNTINQDSLVAIKGMYVQKKGENETYVTDSTGIFSLRISSQEKADSLAVKVSAPDKPDGIGAMFAVERPSATFTSEYINQRQGCECEYSTDAQTYTRTDYYRYDFSNKNVTIP